MIHYVCKYTPIEIFAGFGQKCCALEEMADDLSWSESAVHRNLCGYGRAVVETVWKKNVKELVLVNCCDTMRRIYDILKEAGTCSFLYLLDLPHEKKECEIISYGKKIEKLIRDYENYSGIKFDPAAFCNAFAKREENKGPYLGLLGARVGSFLENRIREISPYPVKNLTCLSNRHVEISEVLPDQISADQNWIDTYASILLSQMPCARMNTTGQRNALFLDEDLIGVIYHTVKFCDFYGFEYAEMKNRSPVPFLKIETDYTSGSAEQINTRIEAFVESLPQLKNKDTVEISKEKPQRGQYVAGIDSGSTSTEAVILDENKRIVARSILPTGGNAAASADKCLDTALKAAGLLKSDLSHIVTTGYGRAYVSKTDEQVTEITCHAKGAFYLQKDIGFIIDIGGQDSKVIKIDRDGNVLSFLMNDKCAAGTGRFFDSMARSLELSLEEISLIGLQWKENITISSICTVFAESEVVSLVAQNKKIPDIVHGLNRSAAQKVASLAIRLGVSGKGMVTGGVANNAGVVQELSKLLKTELCTDENSQFAGAIGAALMHSDF